MYIYLETPGWPLEVPSGIRMRSWSPASACWLQTQPPPGSGEQKHKVNNSRLMLVVCNYPHYLLVGSVIIAGMSSSFPSIQCGNPVWSLRQNDKQTKKPKASTLQKYCMFTNTDLSTVQPTWGCLLLLLGPDDKPALLPTPTQKTHSAGSVPRGWLPGIKAANTQW